MAGEPHLKRKIPMFLKILIGAIIGAGLGYLVMYKLIGCASGACPITRSPVTSTIYGALLGGLFASGA